jgi:PqqD family protein of HPr-rel-A system
LRWRAWDGDFVVYHEQSGDTHFLNTLGARALERLGTCPMAVPELARALADEFGAASTEEESVAAAADLVARFAELGLIERSEDRNDDAEPAATT